MHGRTRIRIFFQYVIDSLIIRYLIIVLYYFMLVIKLNTITRQIMYNFQTHKIIMSLKYKPGSSFDNLKITDKFIIELIHYF